MALLFGPGQQLTGMKYSAPERSEATLIGSQLSKKDVVSGIKLRRNNIGEIEKLHILCGKAPAEGTPC